MGNKDRADNPASAPMESFGLELIVGEREGGMFSSTIQENAASLATSMSTKTLQRVQQCIERQVQYAKLNAFISTPDAKQFQDDGKLADAQQVGTLALTTFVDVH